MEAVTRQSLVLKLKFGGKLKLVVSKSEAKVAELHPRNSKMIKSLRGKNYSAL